RGPRIRLRGAGDRRRRALCERIGGDTVKVHPLLRRELNLRMREWNAFWIPFVYVGTLCLVAGSAYLTGGETEPWRLRRGLFALLSGMSVFLPALAVPVFAAGSITVEREQHALAPLLLTRLSPRAIVFGKLAAAQAYGLLLMSTSLPFLALASALGGASF